MAILDWHAGRDGAPGRFDREPAADEIDIKAVRAHRLGRLRAQMAERGMDACILSDPVNIRYATDTRNMQIFSARNTPARYLIVTADHTVLYEFTGCLHLAEGFETVSDVRPSITASYVAAGDDIARRERLWAAATASDLREMIGPTGVVGVERLNAGATAALAEEGFTLVDAQAAVERARAIKSAEEIKYVVASLRATERGVAKLRDSIRPGITENQLWSLLFGSIIAEGGDYCETRLLNSGERTNPGSQR